MTDRAAFSDDRRHAHAVLPCGLPINLPAVHTESQNILIGAALAEALAICNGMAEQITRQGKQRARSIPPLAPR